jgi:hypothetical protein
MGDKTEETAVIEPTLHPVVELLLARMKSNPDEFEPKGWRWTKLMESSGNYFTEEEHAALREGQRQVSMSALHVAVMNELLRAPEEEVDERLCAQGAPISSQYYQNAISAQQLQAYQQLQQLQSYNNAISVQHHDTHNAYQRNVPVNNSPPPKRWGFF